MPLKSKKPYVYNLDNYNLTLEKLLRFKNKNIHFKVFFNECPQKPLFKLSIKERKLGIEKWYQCICEKVLKKWPPVKYTLIGPIGGPRGLKSSMKVKDFYAILQIEQLKDIFIYKIQDVKKRKKKVEKVKSYFTVFVRFAIQIENHFSGLQDYEDRMVLIKAYNENDAIKRFKKELKLYYEPYLNPLGEMVRWKFDEILDVYYTYEDKIDEEGIEVYSFMKKRRMKPEYEWHPKYKKKQ